MVTSVGEGLGNLFVAVGIWPEQQCFAVPILCCARTRASVFVALMKLPVEQTDKRFELLHRDIEIITRWGEIDKA